VDEFPARCLVMGAWPMAENAPRRPCLPALRCTPSAWSPHVRPAGGQKVARSSGG
jgi:hypothetical protein